MRPLSAVQPMHRDDGTPLSRDRLNVVGGWDTLRVQLLRQARALPRRPGPRPAKGLLRVCPRVLRADTRPGPSGENRRADRVREGGASFNTPVGSWPHRQRGKKVLGKLERARRGLDIRWHTRNSSSLWAAYLSTSPAVTGAAQPQCLRYSRRRPGASTGRALACFSQRSLGPTTRPSAPSSTRDA